MVIGVEIGFVQALPGFELDQLAEEIFVFRQQGRNFIDFALRQHVGGVGVQLADAGFRCAQQHRETLLGVRTVLGEGGLFPEPDFPEFLLQAPSFPIGQHGQLGALGVGG